MSILNLGISETTLSDYLKRAPGVDWRRVSDRIAIHRKLDERNSTMDLAVLDGLRKQIKAMGREPAPPSGDEEVGDAIGIVLLQQRILGETLLAILKRLDEAEEVAKYRPPAEGLGP